MMRALSLLALVGCQSALSPQTSADASGVTGIFVDTTAPEITLDPSMHAAWLAPGPAIFAGTVSDNRSDVDLFVDGQPLAVSPGGTFAIERVLAPGAHTITVSAIDDAGNTSSRTVTAFAGEASPLRRFLPDAARVEASAAVLDVAAEALAADFATDVFTAGSVFSPFSGCVSLDGVVEDVIAGDVWVELIPDAVAQVVYLDVFFEHLSVDFGGVADICGIPEPFADGYASASGATVRLTLTPGADGGQLETHIDRVDVTVDAISVDLPELADSLAEHGLDADKIGVEGAFARALEQPFADRDATGEQIADAIFGVMPAVSLDRQRFVNADLALTSVSITGQGIFGRYTAHHAARQPSPVVGEPEGWLRIAGKAPLPEAADATTAISLDVINHALATAWAGGAFTTEIQTEEGDTAQIWPALPPLVQPDGARLAVTFGEIYVGITGPEPIEAGAPERSTARLFAELRLTSRLERERMSLIVDSVDGEAPSAWVQEALRASIFEALDDALPVQFEPGRLNSGEQVEGHDPVLSGRQQGWLWSALTVTP